MGGERINRREWHEKPANGGKFAAGRAAPVPIKKGATLRLHLTSLKGHMGTGEAPVSRLTYYYLA